MESRIIKFEPLNDRSLLNHSHKVGDLELSFEKLIGTFGEPNLDSDGYKTDVEWGIEFDDGTIASIHNWKNGKTTKVKMVLTLRTFLIGASEVIRTSLITKSWMPFVIIFIFQQNMELDCFCVMPLGALRMIN